MEDSYTATPLPAVKTIESSVLPSVPPKVNLPVLSVTSCVASSSNIASSPEFNVIYASLVFPIVTVSANLPYSVEPTFNANPDEVIETCLPPVGPIVVVVPNDADN